MITSRILVKEDIENVLTHIEKAKDAGLINKERAQQYTAFTLFASYWPAECINDVSLMSWPVP